MGGRGTEPTDPVVRLGRWALDRLPEAFYRICYFGMWGVLRDVDHIPSYLVALFPGVYPALERYGGRFAHKIGYVVLCYLVGGLGAYAIGCVAALVIEMKRGEVIRWRSP